MTDIDIKCVVLFGMYHSSPIIYYCFPSLLVVRYLARSPSEGRYAGEFPDVTGSDGWYRHCQHPAGDLADRHRHRWEIQVRPAWYPAAHVGPAHWDHDVSDTWSFKRSPGYLHPMVLAILRAVFDEDRAQESLFNWYRCVVLFVLIIQTLV